MVGTFKEEAKGVGQERRGDHSKELGLYPGVRGGVGWVGMEGIGARGDWFPFRNLIVAVVIRPEGELDPWLGGSHRNPGVRPG